MPIERLQSLRLEKGISQDELAFKLNVSRFSIINYESGKRIPDINFCINAAKLFDVTLDYLCGLSPYRDKEDYQLSQDLNSYLPKEQKKLVLSTKERISSSFDKLCKQASELQIEDQFVFQFVSLLIEIGGLLSTFNKTKSNLEMIIDDLKCMKEETKVEFIQNAKVNSDDYYIYEKLITLVKNCKDLMNAKIQDYLEAELNVELE